MEECAHQSKEVDKVSGNKKEEIMEKILAKASWTNFALSILRKKQSTSAKIANPTFAQNVLLVNTRVIKLAIMKLRCTIRLIPWLKRRMCFKRKLKCHWLRQKCLKMMC